MLKRNPDQGESGGDAEVTHLGAPKSRRTPLSARSDVGHGDHGQIVIEQPRLLAEFTLKTQLHSEGEDSVYVVSVPALLYNIMMTRNTNIRLALLRMKRMSLRTWYLNLTLARETVKHVARPERKVVMSYQGDLHAAYLMLSRECANECSERQGESRRKEEQQRRTALYQQPHCLAAQQLEHFGC